MRTRQRGGRTVALGLDPCEPRLLNTLVFIFNGNAYSAAAPDGLTAEAARAIEDAGHQAIQLETPTLDTTSAFHSVAAQVRSLGHGQPIGLVGFSAGGTLAARLSSIPSLDVKDVLAEYSPPDLKDYLGYHRGDRFSRYITGRVQFQPGVVDLLSGPNPTTAHVVATFGLADHHVVAAPSTASFRKDYPGGHVYDYPGRHGASIHASPPALDDFLSHL
jgi:hypothetical protein